MPSKEGAGKKRANESGAKSGLVIHQQPIPTSSNSLRRILTVCLKSEIRSPGDPPPCEAVPRHSPAGTPCREMSTSTQMQLGHPFDPARHRILSTSFTPSTPERKWPPNSVSLVSISSTLLIVVYTRLSSYAGYAARPQSPLFPTSSNSVYAVAGAYVRFTYFLPACRTLSPYYDSPSHTLLPSRRSIASTLFVVTSFPSARARVPLGSTAWEE
ncbi:hypothetical protein B0H17DRAFT_1186105 [Mycena rosella]|uniref:Uncharacterized protein n=1 Tax=Mycena rosella TaxID=1033263 RepID=A0AAD7G3E3_MYCRO|nr:hypothetical protein B0H17DRAFT_1186105 [Mycena rosella]